MFFLNWLEKIIEELLEEEFPYNNVLLKQVKQKNKDPLGVALFPYNNVLLKPLCIQIYYRLYK